MTLAAAAVFQIQSSERMRYFSALVQMVSQAGAASVLGENEEDLDKLQITALMLIEPNRKQANKKLSFKASQNISSSDSPEFYILLFSDDILYLGVDVALA